jgi:hypothetical protein
MLAFWFFAGGWAAAKSSTTLQRVAVTVVFVIGMHGYFDRTERELLVLAGFALLIWLPALRCPPAATVVAGVVAEASLYIYLTHFQVYPLFGEHRVLGVIAAVVVGVLITRLVSALRGRLALGDKPFLRHGRRNGTVAAYEAGGHDAASTRSGG